MFRLDFVSNSSSSSFVVSKQAFDVWTRKNGDLQCNYDIMTIEDYLRRHGYMDTEIEPNRYRNGLCNYFYNKISNNDFHLVDDEEYVKRFKDSAVNSIIPLSCIDIMDKFIDVFNRMVEFRQSIPKGHDYTMNDLYKETNRKIYMEYKDIQNEYWKVIEPMLANALHGLSVVSFSGSDDEQSINGYDNDEEYVRSVGHDMCDNIFYRADTCH